MKIVSAVECLESNIDGEEMELRVRFDIDLELSGNSFYDRKGIYVTFDKDGKILCFPNLGDNTYRNPMKYVVLGRAVEEILKFEGERIKKVYDKAVNIYTKEYINKVEALEKESGYRELISKELNLIKEIEEQEARLKRARKEERKESLRSLIDSLTLERNLLVEKEIKPIKQELRRLDVCQRKAIAKLEI